MENSNREWRIWSHVCFLWKHCFILHNRTFRFWRISGFSRLYWGLMTSQRSFGQNWKYPSIRPKDRYCYCNFFYRGCQVTFPQPRFQENLLTLPMYKTLLPWKFCWIGQTVVVGEEGRSQLTPTVSFFLERSHVVCPRQQHFLNSFEFWYFIWWAKSVVLFNVYFDSFTIFLEAYSCIVSSRLSH